MCRSLVVVGQLGRGPCAESSFHPCSVTVLARKAWSAGDERNKEVGVSWDGKRSRARGLQAEAGVARIILSQFLMLWYSAKGLGSGEGWREWGL